MRCHERVREILVDLEIDLDGARKPDERGASSTSAAITGTS